MAMSRAAKRVTIDFLRQKVDALIRHTDADGEWVDAFPLRAAVAKDLKVRFDFENWYYTAEPGLEDPLIGYCTLGNGLTFLGCSAGGDWEYPVWFCIYWDGKKLRAYVPTEGNPFNTTTKQAYGTNSNLEKDRKNFAKRFPAAAELAMLQDQDEWDPTDYAVHDYGAVLNDLVKRIEVRD
jgi:hypothetical protein